MKQAGGLKTLWYIGALLALNGLLAACGSDSGPDAISKHGPGGVNFSDCGACHSAALGSRRAVLGTSGDFAQNAGIASHHIRGTVDPTSDQCLVCHDLSAHASGTVRLKNADTGAAIAYTSPVNMETFCLSCHDTNGANANMTPFADGGTLGATGATYPVETTTRFPTSNEVVTIGWTDPTNAYAANDTLFATASPAQNETIESRWGNFGFDGVLPARMERGRLNSVKIVVRYRVSTQASIALLNAQATVNGTDCPTSPLAHATEPTVDTVVTFDVTGCRTWTRNDLLDANFKVKIGASRGNSVTPVTFSLDYVQVTVTYNGTSYVMSTRIKDDWLKTYGHRQKGLSCLGTGQPTTGCHGNAHGTANVALLGRNLSIPQPNRYRESDFAICLDCHQSYPTVTKEIIFGVSFARNYDSGYGPLQDPLLRAVAFSNYPPYDLTATGGIKTRFSDKNAQGTGKYYDNVNMFGRYLNLHWLHVTNQAWAYRGTTFITGSSCTTCHGVHGTNTQWGMIYDGFQYAEVTEGTDVFGRMYVNAASLGGYPAYCSVNCHLTIESLVGPSHAWFEPPSE